MKIINDSTGKAEPKAGCVCTSGWKSTRGMWQPIWNCNCQCIHGNTRNNNANFKKAKNA